MEKETDKGLFPIAHSKATDPKEAVREFHQQVLQSDTRLVIFFCSNEYDLETLGAEMHRLFHDVEVIGCTTAGEIGPSGYREQSLVGVSLPEKAVISVAGRLDQLQSFDISRGRAFIDELRHQLEGQAGQISPENCFAFLMVDGLSLCEEAMAHVLQAALCSIPVVGGSAGDGLNFGRTYVYHNGRFHSDAAVMALIRTALPFNVFKTQHFIPGDERLVATEVDAKNRIVKEINGLPAAIEYARITGVKECHLSPDCFAASPVVVLINGTYYVRSIQKVNPDDSLTFFCAIDEGLVFRVAHGHGLPENLIQTLENVEKTIGTPQLILACDCILRKLEMIRNNQMKQVEKIMLRYPIIGFNTYGEQFRGLHVNQTLTGIAFGTSKDTADG